MYRPWGDLHGVRAFNRHVSVGNVDCGPSHGANLVKVLPLHGPEPHREALMTPYLRGLL